LTRLLSAAHTRTLLVGPETLKTLLFHMFGDDTIDLSVFVAPHVAFSHCPELRHLSRYIPSVTNHPHGPIGPLLRRLQLRVDNLDVTQFEKDSEQPGLELLRQLCECGGWFHPSTREFVNIAETNVYYVTFHAAHTAL
jgi:hypothetical protein